MAIVAKDRVKETTTTAGTGTLDLAGAVTAFQGFVSAVGSGNECYYTILDANGIDWEVGAGTVTDASPDTLSRTTILDASTSASVPWDQIGADIDGEATGDLSGNSVSLSSDGLTVAIGASNNDGGGVDAGHVRVYEHSGVSWTQKGADIDGEAADDFSGASVSLSDDGSIVAIGGYWNDGTGSNAGHVRVYQYDVTKTTAVTDQTSSDFGPVGWRRLGADIDGEAASDFSGLAVSLSSDGFTVAIGARGNDGSFSGAGHVRVWEYDSGTSSWGQKGADIDGEATDDNSGYSVSLSSDGSIVAIGAYRNAATGFNAGHVRVYQYDADKNEAVTDQTASNFGPIGWNRLGADIDGEAANDQSGCSVSLSSDGLTVAIGATGNSGLLNTAGHVRVWEYDSGTSSWGQKGSDIDGEAEFDASGFSVSLSSDGNIVAISSVLNSDAGNNAGHVRVYAWGGNAWSQKGADIDGEAADDQSGWSVSLSSDGSIVAIGADDHDSSKGHVKIYKLLSSKLRVNLSAGTHTVFLTYPAEKSVYRNADNQIVAKSPGIIFSDDTVQTTAAVPGSGTTYTAGTGLALSGTEFYTANTGNFQQLTFNGGVVRIGTNAGVGAIVCTGSEFIGSGAGYRASGIQISQFFGFQAGYKASGIETSQFFGSGAGYQATGIESSQFFGPKAGYQAKDNSYNVVIGSSAGAETSGTDSSVFLGHMAGSGDKYGRYTSAIGYKAGAGVSGHYAVYGYNQFLGYEAGYQSSKINNVSAIGNGAGREMLVSNGEYFGNRAGEYSVYSDKVVSIGSLAGAETSGNSSSVILGSQAGRFSRNVYHSNLIGTNAGGSLSGHSRYEFATHNNIIGGNAGNNAVGSYNNYIGDFAGNRASGDRNVEINCSGINKIRGNLSGKIHIHDVIIGDSTDGRLAVGSIGTGNLYPDASLEIVSANVNDTGLLVHNLIAAQTGILLPHAVPAVTTNKLYNSSGTLHFDGYPIGSGDSGNFPLTDITVFQGGSGTVPLTIQSWSSPGTLDQAIVNTALIECKDSGGDQSIWRVDQEGDIWMGQSGLTANIITNSGTNNFNIRHTQANKDFNLDYPASNGDFKLRTNDGLDPRTIVDRVVWDSDGNSTHYGSVRVSGALTSEAVPASDTPTTEDATVALDLSTGNYHNIVLGDSVSEFQFINAKRGQRFLLRITQNAVSAKTVSWSTVYSDAGTTAATLKWAGNITPTMSTTVSNTDVYGFLCTNNTGTIRFDGFIIGQDLPA